MEGYGCSNTHTLLQAYSFFLIPFFFLCSFVVVVLDPNIAIMVQSCHSCLSVEGEYRQRIIGSGKGGEKGGLVEGVFEQGREIPVLLQHGKVQDVRRRTQEGGDLPKVLPSNPLPKLPFHQNPTLTLPIPRALQESPGQPASWENGQSA